jgi:SAM-dependent methyltransferase
MEAHYRRWGDPDLVERFASKSTGDFFRTETHFLERCAPSLGSALDIGCASGRMLDLLRGWAPAIDYTGVDIVEANIERARQLYPGVSFHVGNALTFDLGRRYDLVNATGVCQHEPRFQDLIRHMLMLSSRYVMFDVKLADVAEHLANIDRSYCAFGEQRLYYVLLAWPRLRAFLESLPEVESIEVYGYDTAPSRNAHVPREVGRLASAGIFITRGHRDHPAMRVDLPDWLSSARAS